MSSLRASWTASCTALRFTCDSGVVFGLLAAACGEDDAEDASAADAAALAQAQADADAAAADAAAADWIAANEATWSAWIPS